jgi:glycosyltransferase involved in cell wall biosynthesis
MLERAAGTSVAAPVLSVVLPNYNHAAYLPRALDALLSQERQADEIIVVDDCSVDGSRDVVSRYAAKNPSIRLLANEKNIGVISTLSRGLDEARGQFIYFGAADDFVRPGFFADAINMLQAHPQAGLYCGDARLVDGKSGRSVGTRPPARPRYTAGFVDASETARLLRRNDNFILTGAAVFRRDCVVSAGGLQEELSTFADGYLVRKIALTRGFCYAPKVMLTWCIFHDSVSRKTSTEPARAQQVLEKIEAQMATDPAFPAWYRDAFIRRWHFATSRLALQDDPINRDLLITMGAQNAADRTTLNYFLNNFGRSSARALILGFLWWRFRPLSLIDLGTTALARYWEALFQKAPNIR